MAVFWDESRLKMLEDCFLDFALAVFKQMAHWTATEVVPLVRHQQSVFGEGSSWTRQIVEQIDYQQLLNRHRDAILGIKQAQQCGYEHGQAGILKHLPQPNNGDLSPRPPTPAQSEQFVDSLLYPIMALEI